MSEVTVTLNGKPRKVEDGLTLLDLLQRLDVQPGRVVIEHNREIRRREDFEKTSVHAGDELELVYFVGGGASGGQDAFEVGGRQLRSRLIHGTGRFASNQVLTECLEAARRHPAYTDPKAPGEGVGVAVGSWIGAYGPAAAACRMESDGTLLVHLGSIDISGSDTGFAALAAEVFGLPVDKVRIQHTDSTTSPEAPGAGGSATTYSVAPAVEKAVLEARRQVLEAAGALLEAAADDLELADGEVRVKGVPSRTVPLSEVVEFAQRAGGPGPIGAVGRASVADPGPMFCVHIARVQVDEETGQVDVTRYAAIHDIGRALDRELVYDQIHGGVVQGLGRALSEELVYDDSGQLRTGSFADYGLPTADTVPPIEIELVEVPSEHGALGSRGIGEPPIVPGLAALANAIRDATGVRMTIAPFTSEAVLSALSSRPELSRAPAAG
jgi:thiamine biosynthesis protein ThiS